MPEIARFYGIVIKMFFEDHNPPHFHAQYGEWEVLIDINTFAVFAGHFPIAMIALSAVILIAYYQLLPESTTDSQKRDQKGIPMYNLRGGLLAWVHDGGKVYNGTDETHRIHVFSREWNLGPESFEAVW